MLSVSSLYPRSFYRSLFHLLRQGKCNCVVEGLATTIKKFRYHKKKMFIITVTSKDVFCFKKILIFMNSYYVSSWWIVLVVIRSNNGRQNFPLKSPDYFSYTVARSRATICCSSRSLGCCKS